MKKIMKGIVFLSLLSIFTNTTLPVFVSTVKADEIGRVELSEIESEIVSSNEEIPKRRNKRGAVAVFFGGMIVAWVIDGTIKYTTGQAPSDWVAWGLGRVHSYILQQVRNGAGQVIVPQSDPFTCPGVVIDHSGRCQ